MRFVCCLVLCGALIAHSSPSLAQQDRARVLVVVLPLSSQHQAQVEGQLLDTLENVGVDPVSVSEHSAALPAEAAEELSGLESEAEQFELSMELDQASATRGRVIEFLENIGATTAYPDQLAQALSRLAATRIRENDRDEAVRLWRHALALQEGLELDTTFSPSAREAFNEAHQAGATLPPRPTAEALNALCERLDVRGILWIAVGHDEGQQTLIRVLHIENEGGTSEVRYRLPQPTDGAELTVPEQFIQGLERELAVLVPEEIPPPPPPPPPQRFYERWWFWFTIGIVVTGAGVATGLTLTLREPETDVVIHFP